MISVFCCEADRNCALPGYYVAYSGNLLLTFWDIKSLPILTFKKFRTLQMGAIDCPETSVWIFTSHCLIANKSAVLSNPYQNTLTSRLSLS
jgi:hypothetical protein